jgi:hypothetical protein
MGRIKSYGFRYVLFAAEGSEVPDFSDDTFVVIVKADDYRAGRTIPIEEYDFHDSDFITDYLPARDHRFIGWTEGGAIT